MSVSTLRTFSVDSGSYSRYSIDRRLVQSDNNVVMETHNYVDLSKTDNDIYYKVEPGYEGRLDLIANKFLGSPLLYWAIAQANNIYNPIGAGKIGDILRIPSLNTIYGYRR